MKKKKFTSVEEANEFWEKKKKTWKIIGIWLWTGFSLGTVMFFTTMFARKMDITPAYISFLSVGLGLYIIISSSVWTSNVVKDKD